jgi:phospho-N-acetylmuramoyl-pentapeptide-transferase
MGGIVIILASVLGYFRANLHKRRGASKQVSGMLVPFMMVGVRFGCVCRRLHQNPRTSASLGLTGWAKMGGQAVVSILFTWMALSFPDKHGINPASTRISLLEISRST